MFDIKQIEKEAEAEIAKTERARKAVREEQEGQLLDPKPRTQFHAQILSFAA